MGYTATTSLRQQVMDWRVSVAALRRQLSEAPQDPDLLAQAVELAQAGRQLGLDIGDDGIGHYHRGGARFV